MPKHGGGQGIRHPEGSCLGFANLFLAGAGFGIGEDLVRADDLAVARSRNERVVFKLLVARNGHALSLIHI